MTYVQYDVTSCPFLWILGGRDIRMCCESGVDFAFPEGASLNFKPFACVVQSSLSLPTRPQAFYVCPHPEHRRSWRAQSLRAGSDLVLTFRLCSMDLRVVKSDEQFCFWFPLVSHLVRDIPTSASQQSTVLPSLFVQIPPVGLALETTVSVVYVCCWNVSLQLIQVLCFLLPIYHLRLRDNSSAALLSLHAGWGIRASKESQPYTKRPCLVKQPAKV